MSNSERADYSLGACHRARPVQISVARQSDLGTHIFHVISRASRPCRFLQTAPVPNFFIVPLPAILGNFTDQRL